MFTITLSEEDRGHIVAALMLAYLSATTEKGEKTYRELANRIRDARGES